MWYLAGALSVAWIAVMALMITLIFNAPHA